MSYSPSCCVCAMLYFHLLKRILSMTRFLGLHLCFEVNFDDDVLTCELKLSFFEKISKHSLKLGGEWAPISIFLHSNIKILHVV